MFQKIRNAIKKQQGFTLVELLVVVAIIGILAAIAVPKFVNSTAAANGGKVLADLQSIDSAIQQYAASKGVDPSTIDGDTFKEALKTYFSNDIFPTAPTGKIMIKGTAVEIATGGATGYILSAGRATYAGKTAEQF